MCACVCVCACVRARASACPLLLCVSAGGQLRWCMHGRRSPAAIERHAEAHEDGYVRVHLMANGGVNLRLNSLSTRHKRVPSHEALNKMAAQHNSPLPALDRVPPSPGIAGDRWPSPYSSERAERYNSPVSHASVEASRESVETAAAAAGVVPRPISGIPAAGDPQR